MARLDIRNERDGTNYYLEGRKLQDGDDLELLLEKGHWVAGYVYFKNMQIHFDFRIGGKWESDPAMRPVKVGIILPAFDAELRWPKK